MTYYLYLGHLGDFYTKDHELTEDELRCKSYEDYDELIGTFKGSNGLVKLLRAEHAYSDTIEHVVNEWKQEFMIEETISFEDVLDIIFRTVNDLDSSKARKYDLHYTDGWLDACDTLYKYIKGEMED